MGPHLSPRPPAVTAALAVALGLMLLADAGLARAQPADEDEASPADLGEPDAEPGGDEAAAGAEDEEVEAEEIGGPEIDRGEGVTEVGFADGFFIKAAGGKYTLRVSGGVQPAATLTRTTGPRDWTGAFSVRRARLALDGNLHGKALRYGLQLDAGGGVVSAQDLYLDVALGRRLWLRAGQWKRPFSRQQLTPYHRLELGERALTDAVFGAGRDLGVAVHNDPGRASGLEWAVGVFNGTGAAPWLGGTVATDPATGAGTITDGGLTNVPRELAPAVVARVGLAEGGGDGYSEADLEGGPLRWGVAASAWLEGDLDRDDASSQRVQLDYHVKVAGFASTGGFYGMTRQTGAQPFSTQELAAVGFHLQASYLVAPRLHLAARYALIDARAAAGGTAADQHELALGGTYHGHGHQAKVTASVRLVKTGDASLTDLVLFELLGFVGW